jgi:hypothetical protein
LLPQLEIKKDRTFLEAARAHYARAREGLDELARPSADGRPIHPQYVTRVIDKLAAEDAIFTADVGTPTVWAARYLTMNGKRRLVGSFNHGSMANALPQAIGAQAAFPGRQVVSLSGDRPREPGLRSDGERDRYQGYPRRELRRGRRLASRGIRSPRARARRRIAGRIESVVLEDPHAADGGLDRSR